MGLRGQTIIPAEHSLQRANSTMTESMVVRARVHTMLGVDRYYHGHQHFPSTPLWQTLRRRPPPLEGSTLVGAITTEATHETSRQIRRRIPVLPRRL